MVRRGNWIAVLSTDNDRGEKNGEKQEGRDAKTFHKTPQGRLQAIIARRAVPGTPYRKLNRKKTAWSQHAGVRLSNPFKGLTAPLFCDKLVSTRTARRFEATSSLA